MTRQTKTPEQRAKEALDVAERALDRVTVKLEKARAAIQPLEAEQQDARRRRDYLAQSPDLPENQHPEEGDDDPEVDQ